MMIATKPQIIEDFCVCLSKEGLIHYFIWLTFMGITEIRHHNGQCHIRSTKQLYMIYPRVYLAFV